ncbi:MAG: NAD(P)-dependent oxidoreductase [Opitutales bacterium]|nr:NAD(P)-dependent oxidoreductase [Opitutales bacterium]
MPNIFLTGGSGFVGSHFVNHAHQVGYNLHCLRRPGSKTRVELYKEPCWYDGYLEENWSNVLKSCEYFVHIAAAGVDPLKSNYEDLIKANITDSTKLILSAVKSGIQKFLILGTYWEYGSTAESFEFIPVDAYLQPINRYAATKAASCMLACQIAQEHNIKLQYLRIGQVYGEGEPGNRLWPSLRKAALNGEDYHLTLGEQIRNFTPVESIASEVVDALNFRCINRGKPKIANIGSGRPQSLRQFAEYWWSRWHAKGKLHFGSMPYRKDEIMRFVPEV